MNKRYKDLIHQTFDFPQTEFRLENDRLNFHDINLNELVQTYGAPLKFTYLPKISENINRAKQWFKEAFKKYNYTGDYQYCYCTKSSHFKHVLEEALKNEIHIETSSAFDINIVEHLKSEGKISDLDYVICNGFKRSQYITNIARLINNGHRNCIPVIDNYEELHLLSEAINENFNIGIRIASEEEPKSEFYTSRLGIGYKDILPFYKNQVRNNKKVQLKMLHFFISTGIEDSAYYWSEFFKCLNVYVALKKECSELNCLNIGGGFPIKNSLDFNCDYQYLVNEIVGKIQQVCIEANVDVPHLFTEFGSFTVGESGGAIYEVLYQKQQNDREKWNMINSSFITTLPDTWAINKRFIMLPINRWQDDYEEVLLGGLTCDSDDYYNSEKHKHPVYLPRFSPEKPLYIGFFNTGAYQESIGGYSGLQHCLIPSPKHILIDMDDNGNIRSQMFKDEQTNEDFLNILGYDSNQNKVIELNTKYIKHQ